MEWDVVKKGRKKDIFVPEVILDMLIHKEKSEEKIVKKYISSKPKLT